MSTVKKLSKQKIGELFVLFVFGDYRIELYRVTAVYDKLCAGGISCVSGKAPNLLRGRGYMVVIILIKLRIDKMKLICIILYHLGIFAFFSVYFIFDGKRTIIKENIFDWRFLSSDKAWVF